MLPPQGENRKMLVLNKRFHATPLKRGCVAEGDTVLPLTRG